MNGSLTEQLHRMIVRKSLTSSTDVSDSGGATSSSSGTTTDIKKLIKDRDDMWREHARSQISFIQTEHSRMLKALHDEIDRLQQKCFSKKCFIVLFCRR